MGVSSLKNAEEPDPNAPKLQGQGGSSIVIDQGLSKVATPAKIPKLTESAENQAADARAATPASAPKAGVAKPSGTGSWNEGDLNASGVGMMPAGDSLMLRAGDIIDPVTGLPIRAFKAKPKSKLPLIAGSILLVGFAGLMYYISNRPDPPIALSSSEQVASGEGGPFKIVVDVPKGDTIKLKGVEAKVEEKKATVELKDEEVPVGKGTLPLEIKIDGVWKPGAPLPLTRPARAKVTVDKAAEILKFDFEVIEGGKEITLLTAKAKVEGGKAHLEMPFRAMVGPAEQGLTQINKEAIYQVDGVDGDFVFTFSFPAPTPPFVVKNPVDYLVVDKKTDKLPLELELGTDIKLTITVNKEPLAADKDGKYIATLKADENIIVMKAEGKDVAAIEVTRHIFRGTPPAGWNKSEEKPKENKTP
jgi:hypothetical protein